MDANPNSNSATQPQQPITTFQATNWRQRGRIPGERTCNVGCEGIKHLEAAGEHGRVRGGRKKTVALGVWRG